MTTTTNSASVVAANELDRIGNVLTAYDVSPKLGSEDGADGWLPGDPLYDRPKSGLMGHQWVRPMFQVFDEEESHQQLRVPAESHDGSVLEFWTATCETCEVSWEGGGPCWVCGVRPKSAMVSTPFAAVEMRMLQHINNVCAPTVAEIAAAEPVSGLLPALSRASGIPVQRFYYSTTAHRPRLTRRTDPSPLDELMAYSLTDSQRFLLDRWVPGQDPAWETVFATSRHSPEEGVTSVTIEVQHAGETVGFTFQVGHTDNFTRSMSQAVKRIDLQLTYRGGRGARP